MATTPTCQFCGGEHPEQEVTFLGGVFPIRPCPNMPKDWIGVGPDTDGSLVIVDTEGTE